MKHKTDVKQQIIELKSECQLEINHLLNCMESAKIVFSGDKRLRVLQQYAEDIFSRIDYTYKKVDKLQPEKTEKWLEDLKESTNHTPDNFKYKNMTILEAAIDYLKEKKVPQKAFIIGQAIIERGYETNSDQFKVAVTSALYKEAKQDNPRVKKVGYGVWALTEEGVNNG